ALEECRHRLELQARPVRTGRETDRAGAPEPAAVMHGMIVWAVDEGGDGEAVIAAHRDALHLARLLAEIVDRRARLHGAELRGVQRHRRSRGAEAEHRV